MIESKPAPEVDRLPGVGCRLCGHFRGPVVGCLCCQHGGRPPAPPAPVKPANCSACSDERTSRRGQLGQALVEMTLVLPILLALMMGSLELGRMQLTVMQQAQATRTVADLVASDQAVWDWRDIGLFATDCTVDADGDPDRYGIVTVTVTCPYHAMIARGTPLDGRTLTTVAYALLPMPEAE